MPGLTLKNYGKSNMISLIIPTYRNPQSLDLCLKSAVENSTLDETEIIVVVDGFISESEDVIKKYKPRIKVLEFHNNRGMQTAINMGVYNASNPNILIINDDNILCSNWDNILKGIPINMKKVITINQIEPNPSIFNFHTHNYGTSPEKFDYKSFIGGELAFRESYETKDGGIFPFYITKKLFMCVGGFDTMYQSPFICDWDFFLKLDLLGVILNRTHYLNFYHFGSLATKNRHDNDSAKFRNSESDAAIMFKYKWGIDPQLFNHNSHNPKNNELIKGIRYS